VTGGMARRVQHAQPSSGNDQLVAVRYQKVRRTPELRDRPREVELGPARGGNTPRLERVCRWRGVEGGLLRRMQHQRGSGCGAQPVGAAQVVGVQVGDDDLHDVAHRVPDGFEGGAEPLHVLLGRPTGVDDVHAAPVVFDQVAEAVRDRAARHRDRNDVDAGPDLLRPGHPRNRCRHGPPQVAFGLAGDVLALRQLPAGTHVVAGVAPRDALQIVLVLRLSLPERPGGRQLCDDLARPQS
jgi:hypothetical protein